MTKKTLNEDSDFVCIEGGSFEMGSNYGDDNEKPVHTVTVKSFYMRKYLVTQKEWLEVMGRNDSKFRGHGENLPVENVRWYEVLEYCNKLSEEKGLTPVYTIDKSQNDKNNKNDQDSWKWVVDWNQEANGYRLPTEAEWEYAALGGKGPTWNFEYSGSDNIDEVAWYNKNSEGKTHDVGTKEPNRLGLYDMSGNVWEWCWDWYGDYSGGSQTDPLGPSSGSTRVERGGSWDYGAGSARPVSRRGIFPHHRSYQLGFRLVRS